MDGVGHDKEQVWGDRRQVLGGKGQQGRGRGLADGKRVPEHDEDYQLQQ